MSDTPQHEPRESWFGLAKKAIAGSSDGEDFARGDLRKAIILLSVPMVLEMAMESVFAVADVFFVSKVGGTAVATVGLTESLLVLVYALAFGLSMSTTALVARRIGEKDHEGASRAAVQALWVGGTIAAIIGVFGVLFAPDLLRLMGAEAEVLAEGTTFARVALGTNIVVIFLFLQNGIFRGAGDAQTSMRALWIANAINIVLDPCFIFGLGPFPELGVTGAAVATSIGRGTGVLYQMWRLGHGERIRIGLRHLKVRLDVMVNLLRVSAGGVAQQVVATASWVGVIRILATFGSDTVAGYTIAVRVIIFALLPSWGLANAAATLVGQSLGAGDPDRAAASVWRTGKYNMVFLGLISVVMIAIPETIIGLFDPENATILRVGSEGLRIIAYGYVFYAWEMVMVQAFNGAGDTFTPTKINLFCFWLIQVGLAWVLAKPVGMGANGVFTAVAISYSVAAVIAIWLFKRGSWRKVEV